MRRRSGWCIRVERPTGAGRGSRLHRCGGVTDIHDPSIRPTHNGRCHRRTPTDPVPTTLAEPIPDRDGRIWHNSVRVRQPVVRADAARRHRRRGRRRASRPGPFTEARSISEDLRRPGGHRHRNVRLFKRAASADAGADLLGRAAHGPRRGRPGGQLDARPRDRARPRSSAGRSSSRAPTGARSSSTTRAGESSRLARDHAVETDRSRWLRQGAASEGKARRPRGGHARADPGSGHRGTRRLREASCADGTCSRGFRALLAVPLVREDRLIGWPRRRPPRGPASSPPEAIELAADVRRPSALAIQNARLFRRSRTRAASSKRPASTSPSSWPTCPTSCARR